MNKKGFTLIELLVVISIIGILAGMTMVSYTGAQKQARDTQLRSDLAQYRNGLESYATNNNSLYPVSIARANMPGGVLCTGAFSLMPSYISACPADPLNSAPNLYHYRSNAAGDTWVLWAPLETNNSWEVCSNGKSGKVLVDIITTNGDLNGGCSVP